MFKNWQTIWHINNIQWKLKQHSHQLFFFYIFFFFLYIYLLLLFYFFLFVVTTFDDHTFSFLFTDLYLQLREHLSAYICSSCIRIIAFDCWFVAFLCLLSHTLHIFLKNTVKNFENHFSDSVLANTILFYYILLCYSVQSTSIVEFYLKYLNYCCNFLH